MSPEFAIGLLTLIACPVLAQKVIPKPRTLAELNTQPLPTLRIVYCATSGYQRTLQQYVSLLSEKYEGQVLARGEAFQHSAWAHYVSYALTTLKLTLAALFMFKVNILRQLQSRYPRIVEFAINNRMLSTIFVFLLISTLEAKLTSTGHFEIYYNDVPVWSKLASGRFPTPGELFQIIDNQILIKNSPRISL
ncbi:putative selT-like protein C35C5.3 [Varroa jacobsoni]|uniref:Selenoprotein T n=1 Tax=Varroa destructor TaxID=109461 RepID=A0A7M7KJH6_VARDE|nr:putative selT-like protein C35C5.3 [Varroa destructor]XP_022694861.1 putative selT-like protein C35C5.3 [Varroa jacobsoni]